ncbi:ABC transporter permease [Chitinimonas taiwanensis]|jgi:arginine/ornithine transport system permease protein|uniref:Arginine/ornithine transport system permease protein n=1 Tax=Chitinimonas taiwanensis DSM 18899 TaxID=1121279 RepID=A0A1K2H6M8_9NEIS|nr:ABC transporter permease subunit [Chitinimonas taiwanensis]SFZ71993.1 arginine/ornithine transport system permease protein [Chitinimonas taiwanensis DSM 18899]
MEEYVLNILKGSVLTLEVALGSLLVAVVLGLLGATAKLSQNKLLNWLAGIYSTVIRGIPDLVLMLLIFYGGQILLNLLLESVGYTEYVEINPFVAGVLTIGFIYGAYMTETFRGAIMAIPKGQMEAGLAFGMSNTRVFFRITVPQMIRLALPSFTNNWLVLIKATALVSILGLPDMTMLAKQAASAARGITPMAPMLFFLFTGAIYLAFTTISLVVLKQLDKKYSMGVRRGEF